MKQSIESKRKMAMYTKMSKKEMNKYKKDLLKRVKKEKKKSDKRVNREFIQGRFNEEKENLKMKTDKPTEKPIEKRKDSKYWLVNIKEEKINMGRGGTPEDTEVRQVISGTVWGPDRNGNGYNLIRDVSPGDCVIQYAQKSIISVGIVQTSVAPMARHDLASTRHVVNGHSFEMNHLYYNDTGSRLLDDILLSADIDICPNFNPYVAGRPITRRTCLTGVYAGVTTNGYMWDLNQKTFNAILAFCQVPCVF